MTADRGSHQSSADQGADRLFRTARHLFLEHGYANVSMQQIAEAAGMTKGAPYYHFENKKALFVAVSRQVITTLRDNLLAPGETDGTLRDHLRTGMAAVLQESEGIMSVWIADFFRVVEPPELSPLLNELLGLDDLRHLLVSVFAEAANRGETLNVPPTVASAIFMKLLFMTVDEDGYLTRYGLLGAGDRERNIDEVIQVFLVGIRGRLD